ncbi:MAG: type III secretion system effector protein [Granulosicoccus sp.]|nr:type III secretion system effector protein [Granulosicoccus sp.]
MLIRFIIAIVVLMNVLVAAGASANSLSLVKATWPSDAERVRRNYRDTSQFLHSGYGFYLDGAPAQIAKISRWLDKIYQLPIGRQTIDAIMESQNRLIVRHSTYALVASGRTSAPVTRHLSDGVGEDVVILFDARIPDEGSHHVYDSHRQPIAFNALHNLFHELSHANHMLNGSWLYFDSEGQAIREENVFRRQLAEMLGLDKIELRVGQRGRQVWFP